jgi:hypothetical protein
MEHALFPLRDDNPTLLTPVVTIVLILANVAVWLYVQGMGAEHGGAGGIGLPVRRDPGEVTGQTGGTSVELGPRLPACELGGCRERAAADEHVPARQLAAPDREHVVPVALREQRRGRHGPRRFLVFYLLTGVLAAAAHIFSAPDSLVPVVGASGAISAVMGAYLLLYPRIRIQTLFIFVIIFRIIPVPAWFVLILWFALQLLSGYTDPVATSGWRCGRTSAASSPACCWSSCSRTARSRRRRHRRDASAAQRSAVEVGGRRSPGGVRPSLHRRSGMKLSIRSGSSCSGCWPRALLVVAGVHATRARSALQSPRRAAGTARRSSSRAPLGRYGRPAPARRRAAVARPSRRSTPRPRSRGHGPGRPSGGPPDRRDRHADHQRLVSCSAWSCCSASAGCSA